MKSFDYSFFAWSLKDVRKLKGTTPWWILDGARKTASPEQLEKYPKIIIPPDEYGEGCIFETTSYATAPGSGLARVQEIVGNPLPHDIVDFYTEYQRALVVTRTYPLHIWDEEKIIEGIGWFREFFDKPFRVFRFGEQYAREATQFALWLEEPGTMKWRVITTASGVIDDMDDNYVEPDRIIGLSFYEWLKSWIERDGLPDPCMDLGPEGGFLDPP